MKKIFSIILCSFLCFAIQAQNANDALRYSLHNISGTARSVGLGGTLGALGGDFSTLSGNPAGLAAYRKSEFSFSPNFLNINNDAKLLSGTNESIQESKNDFNLSNLGFVFHSTPRSGNWKTFNVGIGINQIANYEQEIYYEGMSHGSLVQSYAEQANGFDSSEFDSFSTGLAWETGAIYPLSDTDYITDFEGTDSTQIFRNETINTSGNTNELVFSFAGNMDNKLMIGATIGVPFVSWEENRLYAEEDQDDEIPFFNQLSYEESISTSGVGINAKFGLIYRINQMFRVGTAIHTPTAYGLTDTYTSSLTYDYTDSNNDGPISATSPNGSFSYRLSTPWRAMLNAAAIIGSKKTIDGAKTYVPLGFISAEVEWADYSSSAFNYSTDANGTQFKSEERAVNSDIGKQLKSAVSFRIGAEYVRQKLRIRAGYGINGSPFAGSSSTNNTFSGGLGIYERNFYLDFAYQRTSLVDSYSPYTTIDAPRQIIATDTNRNKYMFTLGFRFGR